MVTDLRKCVACQACTVACSAEWAVPAGHARTHVRTTPLAGTFPDLTSSPYVGQCNQCDRPPCVEPCPSGATYQDADGIVRVDGDLCIGRPEHLDLVLTSFPPRRPRLLTAGEAWTKLLKPLVLVMVGATFAGQAVAFFTQLRK